MMIMITAIVIVNCNTIQYNTIQYNTIPFLQEFFYSLWHQYVWTEELYSFYKSHCSGVPIKHVARQHRLGAAKILGE